MDLTPPLTPESRQQPHSFFLTTPERHRTCHDITPSAPDPANIGSGDEAEEQISIVDAVELQLERKHPIAADRDNLDDSPRIFSVHRSRKSFDTDTTSISHDSSYKASSIVRVSKIIPTSGRRGRRDNGSNEPNMRSRAGEVMGKAWRLAVGSGAIARSALRALTTLVGASMAVLLMFWSLFPVCTTCRDGATRYKALASGGAENAVTAGSSTTGSTSIASRVGALVESAVPSANSTLRINQLQVIQAEILKYLYCTVVVLVLVAA